MHVAQRHALLLLQHEQLEVLLGVLPVVFVRGDVELRGLRGLHELQPVIRAAAQREQQQGKSQQDGASAAPASRGLTT